MGKSDVRNDWRKKYALALDTINPLDYERMSFRAHASSKGEDRDFERFMGMQKETTNRFHKEAIQQGTRMKMHDIKWIIAILIGLGLQQSTRAGSFHFPVGISYASGIQDATDKLVDFYRQDGFNVDRIDIPIGLTLNPYYEWDSGLGVGVSVGPTAFILVDEKNYNGYGYSSDTTKFSYAVPVGGFVRYTLWRDRTVAPYIRAGVRYPLAGGDNLESSRVGPFGAVGVEFWRTKKVGMSIEVGYDASEIKVKYANWSKNVTFGGFMAGLSVVF